MKLSFYTTPINAFGQDRFYGGGGLNTPSFSIDTKANEKNKVAYQFANSMLLNLKINNDTIGTKNFNYLKIEEYKVLGVETTYWFLLSSKDIIGTNSYQYNFKLDIFNTFDVLKQTSKDIPIDIERKTPTGLWRVSNNVLFANYIYNPKIWNNNEFANLNSSKVKQIDFIKPKELKFQYTPGGSGHQLTTSVNIKFKWILAIFTKYFGFNKKNDNSYFDLALVSQGNDILYIPVLYLQEGIKKDEPIYNTASALRDDFLANGNEHHYHDAQEFITHYNTNKSKGIYESIILNVFKLVLDILNDAAYQNKYENLKSNQYVQTIIGVSDIFYHSLPSQFWFVNGDEDEILKLFNFEGSGGFSGVNRWRLKYTERGFWGEAIKEQLTIAKDKLFDDYDNYKYLNYSLLSSNYKSIWLSYFGNQIKLNNRKIYSIGKSETNLENYIGIQKILYNDEELIGVNYDSASNLKHSANLTNRIPIAYTKDVGTISYLTRKNYYDSRLSQVALNRASGKRLVEEQTQNKIFTNNNLISNQVVNNLNLNSAAIRASNRGYQTNTDTSLWGMGLTGIATIGAAVFSGGSSLISQGAILAGGGLNIGNSIIGNSLSGAQLKIQNTLRTQSTQIQNAQLQQQGKINNQLLRDEQEATIRKLNSDSRAQKGLILGEIADLENLPSQLTNESEGSIIYKPYRKVCGLFEDYIDKDIEKKMWLYFNLFGNENWGTFNLIKGDNTWFQKNSFFDYFKGGDWTLYLNDIGIYNKEIINEFNVQMATGVRLWHNRTLTKIDNSGYKKNELNYLLPNYEYELVKSEIE